MIEIKSSKVLCPKCGKGEFCISRLDEPKNHLILRCMSCSVIYLYITDQKHIPEIIKVLNDKGRKPKKTDKPRKEKVIRPGKKKDTKEAEKVDDQPKRNPKGGEGTLKYFER